MSPLRPRPSRFRPLPRRPLLRPAAAATLAAVLVRAGAAAAATDESLLPAIDLQSAFGSAVIIGLLVFATTLAIQSVRDRRRWTERERALTAEVARLRDQEDRAAVLLGSERQVLILWDGPDAEPVVEGDPASLDDGMTARRVLAFGAWLAPADAGALDAALGRLRGTGEAFRSTLATAKGRFFEAEGRTVGGRALLRIRGVSDERAALLAARAENEGSRAQLDTVRALLDAIDEPVWLRGPDGRLAWTNRAYDAAVEAVSVRSGGQPAAVELLDRRDREVAAASRTRGTPYRARVTAVVAGSRRVLDVLDAPLPAETGGAAWSGGIARDATELDDARSELGRQAAAHVRVLDHLPIAVASFDDRQRLVFHNAEYRRLWNLTPAFLDGRPGEGEILDHLRAANRLPEQSDFRKWKDGLLEAYRSAEPGESWWHLPDRRTLRVVANPNPQGGLTYLFDDVSGRLELESRLAALTRTQRETLDTLTEGVALFGQDGRLKLFNHAFAELWRLPPEALDCTPHVDSVVQMGRALAPAEAPWTEIRSRVSGLQEQRERFTARMSRLDGTTVDVGAEPLPGGATLLTFADVSAQVKFERALTERNEALEHAARIRDDFVHHVSYELRSPLTTVIGFAELLGAETVGPLNERQRDYAGHITRSSGSLLAIINDILDLASIDTDTIELSWGVVNVRAAVDAAADAIKDRLVEGRLTLDIDAPPSVGSFEGDAQRVRQVVYNLLSNAAGFSREGQVIRVTVRDTEDAVLISVSDQGRGIAPDKRGRVFDRFETDAAGTAHRGAGLGLSIVRSFVELHGGHVELVSEPGAGTTVTCSFPARGRRQAQLAASLPDDRGEDASP